MNDLYKECINTANYIADKISDKTGYKAALKKIKESSDPDDFYILYKMTINGQDYKLYAGEEDFTIAGEDWLKDYLRELNDKEMYRACM